MSTLEVKAIQAPSGFELEMPTGHIVQSVSSSYAPTGSDVTITATSYTDSGLSATITPKASGNKIIIVCSLNAIGFADSGGDLDGWNSLALDGTTLVERRWNGDNMGKLGDSVYFPYSSSFQYTHTTVNANAHTFKVRIKCDAANRYHRLKQQMTSTMLLMEVQG